MEDNNKQQRNCDGKRIFSIDVEEWFHLNDTESVSNDISKWDLYPARVEETFKALLKLLDTHNTKATCFFVGWIAEKYPELVKLAYDNGHEIGIHGYFHRLVYTQTYEEFYNELYDAKKLIEGIIDDKVYGFRAPSFSIREHNLWAYKALMELGFTYSSSVDPGQYKNFGLHPTMIYHNDMQIMEIPLPVVKFPFSSFSCFGGGYFRLFPLFWFNVAAKFINNRPLTFYIHPRDIDLKHPELNVPLKRKFKSLVNIKSTPKKIAGILSHAAFSSFIEVFETFKNEQLQHATLSSGDAGSYSLLNTPHLQRKLSLA